MQMSSLINDNQLRDEIVGLLESGNLPISFAPQVSKPSILSIIENPQITEGLPASEAESIIRLFGRPVLTIRRDTFENPASETWRQRLEAARRWLEPAIPSVGRIELKNHPSHDWVGTGWLVRDDVIVTNRHVAEYFAFRNSEEFSFRLNSSNRQITARIDFLEEFRLPGEAEVRIREVLHIEPANGPDLALLRINAQDTAGRQAIRLAPSAEVDQYICTIGYPAQDSRIPDPTVMRHVFGNVYDVKRLAPGKITNVSTDLEHDCSTLGGNSGSVVLELETGGAVGLHFGGQYRTANYAVPASVIQERLSQVA